MEVTKFWLKRTFSLKLLGLLKVNSRVEADSEREKVLVVEEVFTCRHVFKQEAHFQYHELHCS